MLSPKGDDADELHERKFWKALGVNPPLYGADTPQSLFDEEVEFGWNLRDLGCLLHRCDVPDIPGVTTPMTYFGMWRVSSQNLVQVLLCCAVMALTHCSCSSVSPCWNVCGVPAD